MTEIKEAKNCKVTVVQLPEHLRDLNEDASLQEVIKAINFHREQERATYLAPRTQWTDIRGSDIEIAERYVTE